jgi:hypothetical protein
MNKNQTTQLSTDNHDLLVDALRILQELVSAVENDIFTDAPERALSVTDAEAAIRQAHQVFRTLERAAWQILHEAENAFEAMSVARERSANGEWPAPQSIPDFLMWIQDEWEIQDHLVSDSPKDSDLVYASALLDLVEELRALGFEPSPAPWQLPLQNAQLEMA